MFTCASCPRTFASKSSLNRHARNHQQARRWQCTICQAKFARQDLLTRHSRIHLPSSDSAGLQGRQRSRIACNTCRTSRAKCIGPPPCDRCQAKGLFCSLSEVHPSETSGHNLSPADDLDTSDAPPISTLHSHQNESHRSQHANLPVEQMTIGLNDLDHISDSLFNLDGISPNCISWPWLHEDAFLRTDLTTNLDWFDFQPGNEQFLNKDATTSGDHRLGSSVTDMSDSEHPDHACDSLPQPVRTPNLPLDRTDVVVALVNAASSAAKNTPNRSDENTHALTFYKQLDDLYSKILIAFAPIGEDHSQYRLDDFIKLYVDNFWQLWPLCPRYQFDNSIFDPFLYLAMVSIGAMYGSKHSGIFGTMLHTALREELVNPLLDINLSSSSLLPLGQARALTQAAALYFGQKRAFSYAFHLGGALVAQARKMNLFVQNNPDIQMLELPEIERVQTWLRRESKKRLAFATLRLEMYTSALHSTRPLLSAKEMNIELPCSRYLWFGSFTSHSLLSAAVQQELSTRTTIFLYSDLFRIATDTDEQLPQMEMLHHELLSNAMQEQVWEAASAKSSLDRQTPKRSINSDLPIDYGLEGIREVDSNSSIRNDSLAPKVTAPISVDSQILECYRQMSQLQHTVLTTTAAMRKCRRCALADSARLSDRAQLISADRSSLLSCLLIYHLGFLQIHAPMEQIHSVCHLTLSTTGPTHDPRLTPIIRWSETSSALAAQQHATRIYNLLLTETQHEKANRASVNFLTMIGLYHCAVLTWVYNSVKMSTEPAKRSAINDIGFSEGSLNVSQASTLTMVDFVQVFQKINPQWATRSSFLTAIEQLSNAKNPFALLRAPER